MAVVVVRRGVAMARLRGRFDDAAAHEFLIAGTWEEFSAAVRCFSEGKINTDRRAACHENDS